MSLFDGFDLKGSPAMLHAELTKLATTMTTGLTSVTAKKRDRI
jgi:hypothetical protein